MSAPLKEPTDPVRVILSADVIYDEDNDAYTLTTEQFPTGVVGFDHDFKRYFNFSFCYTITKHSTEGTGTLKFQWGDKYAYFTLSVNHSATAGATYEVTYTDDRLQLLDTISSGPLTGFAYDTVQTVRIDAMFDTLFIYLDNARISTDDMDVSEYENAFINPVILWEATNIGFGVFTHQIDTIFCLNNVVFEEPVFVNQSIYAKEFIGVTWDSLGDNPLPYVLQYNESQPEASNVFVVLGTADDSNIAQLDVINSNHMISLGVPIEAHSNAFLTTFGPSGLALGTDGNERVIITPSGNVGIGTTAPTELLDVAGVIRADHYIATSTALCSNLNAEFLSGRDSNWYRQYANLIGTPEILNSQWTTNGTSIHYNSGNVGIGSDVPTEQLDVAGLVRAARYLATTTGLCSNVNADLLDGQEGDWYRDFANLLNKPDIVENEEMSSLLSAISSSIIGSAAGGIGGAIGGFLKGLFSPDGSGGFQLDGVNWEDINGKPEYMSRWSGDSYNVNNIVGCLGDGLSGGYVGIGVEHPTHKLDVKGVTQLDGTLKFKAGPNDYDFQTTFENYGDDFVIATGSNQLTPSSHVVLKRSAGGEQQTEFAGSVGIGTSPVFSLDVAGIAQAQLFKSTTETLPPFEVNSLIRVDNLNASLLDGNDAGKFMRTDNDTSTTGNVTAKAFTSTVTTASGGAPFVVASTNKVVNLNCDLLDGNDSSFYLNYANLTGTPTIPAAQIQSDWNQTNTTALDYIKNKPSVVTSGSSPTLTGATINGEINTNTTIRINNSSPTICFQDTNHNSGFIHVNDNLMYVLRGGNNATGWTAVNGQWPWIFNLANNDSTCGGNLSVVGNITPGGKIVVQNSQNGGSSKGIYMWNAGDTNWGIYMATSGAGCSLSGGTAVGGGNVSFTSHAIRFRVYNDSGNGFIWENSSENVLMSLRASDGYLYVRSTAAVGNLEANNVSAAVNLISYGGLQVNGTVTIATGRWHQSSDGRNRLYFANDNGPTYFGGYGFVWRNSSDTTIAQFTESGSFYVPSVYNATSSSSANVYVSSGGFIRRSTSSRKYKTDIEDLPDESADKIFSCRPVQFKSLCDDDNKDKTRFGLIAEEVAEHLPELVSFGENNNEPEGVEYDHFVSLLINVAKRQRDKIMTLEARLAAIEEKLGLV